MPPEKLPNPLRKAPRVILSRLFLGLFFLAASYVPWYMFFMTSLASAIGDTGTIDAFGMSIKYVPTGIPVLGVTLPFRPVMVGFLFLALASTVAAGFGVLFSFPRDRPGRKVDSHAE